MMQERSGWIMNMPPLHHDHRNRLEWLVLVIVIALCATGLGWFALRSLRDTRQAEIERLRVQSHVIAENLLRELQSTSHGLAVVREELSLQAIERLGPQAQQRLVVLTDLLAGVRTLVVADAQGVARAANRPELVGRDFRHREEFVAALTGGDPQRLYVSSPFRTLDGQTSITLSRAMHDAQGRFSGVVAAVLDPGYFEGLLQAVLYAPDMRATLIHARGRVVVQVPSAPQLAASDVSQPGSFFSRFVAGGREEEVMTGRTAGGLDRLSIGRRIGQTSGKLLLDEPLVLFVGRNPGAVTAAWRTRTLLHASVLASLAIVAALSLYGAQWRRRSAQLQAAQRESEAREGAERLALALHGADLGLWDWRADAGTCVYNQRWATMLGLELAEVQGDTNAWAQRIHPEDWPAVQSRLQAHLQGQTELFESEHRMRHRDGHWVWILDRGKVVQRNERGEVQRMVGTHLDITRRVQVEQALRRSEERLQLALHAANDALWDWDLTTGEMYYSPRWWEMLGRDEGSLPATPSAWRSLASPQDVARVDAAFEEAQATGRDSYQVELALRHADGHEVPVRSRAHIVRDAAGGVVRVSGVSTDLTEQRRAEAARSLLEAQLRESQKMESVGTLAGGIAHDFNNILAAILGHVAMVRQDLPAEHAAQAGLEQVHRSAVRARGLVQQILAFSRRDALEPALQPLQPLVAETLSMLRATLPATVRLDAALSEPDIAVHVDATQIQQVLLNLCTNAWHALNDGAGVIEVGVDGLQIDYVLSRETGMPAGSSCAHLWVRDNGIGMDDATRQRIFEPFFTTKPVGRGTGLGLAVAHGIIKRHGGAIQVVSSPGAGSTFHLYLPLADTCAQAGPAAPEVPGPASDSPAGARGRHVMYVDDDEVIVLMVESLLQRAGFEVTGCRHGREALERLADGSVHPDIVVTDHAMPEFSGLDLARALQRQWPDLPVIISSGYISDELVSAARGLGVRHLLHKQHTHEELVRLIHEVLGEAVVASP